MSGQLTSPLVDINTCLKTACKKLDPHPLLDLLVPFEIHENLRKELGRIRELLSNTIRSQIQLFGRALEEFQKNSPSDSAILKTTLLAGQGSQGENETSAVNNSRLKAKAFNCPCGR